MNSDFLPRLRAEWLGNIRADVLSGLVVALALIPEAIAFSIIAGVDPKVGLYASFSIAAVLMGSLVREHGLDYLLAATVLAGVIQMLAGALRLGSLMRFVSKSVMTGFVNALAILIFMAQLPELTNVSPMTYVMVAGGLAIIYLFPRITKVIPSPLICIIVLTGLSFFIDADLRTVGDMGALPDAFPAIYFPDVPLNLDIRRRSRLWVFWKV